MLPTRIKIFVYAVLAVVCAAIIAGLFAVGSPQNKRLQNFDNRRIQDLQMLQNEIVNFWQVKNALPANLVSLNDSTRGVSVPQDPQTGAEYEYLIRGPLAFTLCANFSLPESNNPSPLKLAGPYSAIRNGEWGHGAGRTCFERTIDTDFYKSLSPQPVPVK